MNSLSLHYSCFQENQLVSTSANNDPLTSLSAMMTSLDNINNSSLNLSGGSVVKRSSFFAPPPPAIMTKKYAAVTYCYSMYAQAISYGDALSHRESNDNLTVSGSRFSQEVQCVEQRSVISQGVQTEDVLSHIDESKVCDKMRKETVKKSALFVKNLSLSILMLSRAGIDIPDGLSPHTIYCHYTREKRTAEQSGSEFNHADFQHRINCKAKKRLPRLIKKYNSTAPTAESVFSALHSRYTQQTFLQIIGKP